jgi:hypothetical protein
MSELNDRQTENQINPKIAERLKQEFKALENQPASNSPGTKKRGKPKRPANEGELLGLPCSTIPPVNPADILYQAMVRRWGRYYNGGEAVWELVPFSDSGYRLDASLPRYRIGCEVLLTPCQIQRQFQIDPGKAVHVLSAGMAPLPAIGGSG